MAGDIASNSPLSIAVIKEQLNIMGAAKPINSEFYEIIDELRQKAFNSNDYREGIKAFYEKRKPKFTGE
jgi:methylmalonyl-CoA decarboxylase